MGTFSFCPMLFAPIPNLKELNLSASACGVWSETGAASGGVHPRINKCGELTGCFTVAYDPDVCTETQSITFSIW